VQKPATAAKDVQGIPAPEKIDPVISQRVADTAPPKTGSIFQTIAHLFSKTKRSRPS